ncbi:acetyl-CoA hydrolase/transferase-like protein [Tamilnaduibacter salinus]|uniref:Acetyl-CoA hydrolase/transferase-like protein n=1 Tax=Tamilnaduibacter salinus TaxID=1484056 RepID=A0A2U1D0P1_9GAMM|nr:acetyl-CoA hydrolase/transferase C-terminal domain-containing protein [Tamilnaduibacter salinus]PVY78944.1 acetyl-CoA hydrolase/transferase-like protein [Tamilnaduibacter salinus]
MSERPERLLDTEACVDAVIARVGRQITLGLPLGLGKPVHLVNALYQRACRDPSLELHIVTALSTLVPAGGVSLEKRFLGPFTERVYDGVPELAYARDARGKQLPRNVRVSEFFFQAGSQLNNPDQQQHYICTNYTHAVRDLLAMGVNVVGQMVAPHPDDDDVLSLSCNPDLSLDLAPVLRERADAGAPVMLVGETNRNLPYLGNDARVASDLFDLLYDRPSDDYPLFPVPEQPISAADHLIGFYASALIQDGGTLQVGIGSLGSALVYSTVLRHTQNAAWRAVFNKLDVAGRFPVVTEWGGTEPFREGLYGCSEMLVDGFLELIDAGILTREVYPHTRLQTLLNEGRLDRTVSLATLDTLREAELIHSPLRARDVQWLQQYGVLRDDLVFRGGRLSVGDHTLSPDLDDDTARARFEQVALGTRLKGGTVLHGGFYIGPERFYERLRSLSDEQARRLCMTSIGFINHLYDHRFGNQALKTAQRREGRFVNSAMMATLDGAVVSDGLEDGRVVSGVGGQYNFVAMAQELPRARSILALRSTRVSGGDTVSNIVFSYGHCTIPRHLRDIVITEYGIADLRGRPDSEVYLEMIRIADARFQPELLRQAQKAGKVPRSFRLPEAWQRNTPERVREAVAIAGADRFPAFPFGCAFTDEERQLMTALSHLKSVTGTRRQRMKTLWRALREAPFEDGERPLLERMGLHEPERFRDRIDQRLLVHALRRVTSNQA